MKSNCEKLVPHRRFNPLLRKWILVSPQRLYRPWDGQKENKQEDIKLCNSNNPLRPNTVRDNGETNPNYDSIYVFQNDFPALINSEKQNESEDVGDFNFFRNEKAGGDCKVMCFHPSSDVTLATMEHKEVIDVIKKWISLTRELCRTYTWIQIFENRGEMMGCSNSHPHCQIWSTEYLPDIPTIKNESLLKYYKKFKRPMLNDYVKEELEAKERIVVSNEYWICLVPYWAEWPFEVIVLPLRSDVRRFFDLNANEIDSLAEIMQKLLNIYNGLFSCEFPYSMGWHGAPTGLYMNKNVNHWTFHGIYYPPLVRSATVKKFFVGFELLAESQRDLTAEKAAELLRNVEV